MPHAVMMLVANSPLPSPDDDDDEDDYFEPVAEFDDVERFYRRVSKRLQFQDKVCSCVKYQRGYSCRQIMYMCC